MRIQRERERLQIQHEEELKRERVNTVSTMHAATQPECLQVSSPSVGLEHSLRRTEQMKHLSDQSVRRNEEDYVTTSHVPAARIPVLVERQRIAVINETEHTHTDSSDISKYKGSCIKLILVSI
jgi:hypothetical protein